MTTNIFPCFQASGGYNAARQFETTVQRSDTPIKLVDFTGAVEVYFDVRTFNNLIGIQKDVANINIITKGYFDSVNGVLLSDNISIPASTFVSGLYNKPTSVASVGKFYSFYQDFAQYIATYFSLPTPTSNTTAQGIPHGLGTLYSNEYDFYPNNGIFDAQALINILNPSVNQPTDISPYGPYISPLTGTIELVGITNALRNAVITNPFGNRNRDSGLTASDVLDRTNYGVSDGFFDGDVIYISGGNAPVAGVTPSSGYYGNGTVDGISLSLKLVIDPKTPNADTNGVDLITRTLGAPLVIRLVNQSLCFLVAALSTITYNSVKINISGTFSTYIVTRTAGASLISTVINQTVDPVIYDTTLTQYTTYYYTITPIDSNGYYGVAQSVHVTTPYAPK